MAVQTYWMLLVFNFADFRWYLEREALDVALEILVIVNLSNHIAHAALLWTIGLIARAHQQTITEE